MNLAENKFKITNEQGIESELTLEMYKNEREDYGNGHSLCIIDNGNETLFDARYDNRFDTLESFHEHSYEFVREYVRESCKIEQIN